MTKEQKTKNPFVYQSALVTTIFNYFGYTSFTSLFPLFRAFGLLSPRFKEQAWMDCVDYGIASNAICHPDIYDLMPHSVFINFLCRLKPFFMKEFNKTKSKYFPADVHGDALFYGSIVHSIDHCAAWKSIEDPLWLDTKHQDFGLMAEMARIVVNGFTHDLPALSFKRFYKEIDHPFYRKVYEKAKSIDPILADQMDTCIVK